MAAEHATHASFALAPATRAGAVLAGGAHVTHRDFTDFVVDGRPLLFRLADLDAVSPLAADVPPVIFAEQVRALLLEAPAPLPGGRYLVYGCPECADLACGAVTAVIERDGEDYVWRDFAWQSDDHPDLRLNGYHGLGPFRFRGAEYCEALTGLLESARGTGARGRRVLLIGARAAVLNKLAAALRSIGIGADIGDDPAEVPPEELRAYGVVAFGRAVGEERRHEVRAAFRRAGAEVAYVDGLAPVIPLLVAQTEEALDRRPEDRRRLAALRATEREAVVEVSSDCRVGLTVYRMDRLRRTHEHIAFDDVLSRGSHRLPLDPGVVRGDAFLVARTSGEVRVAAVPH
ncbi:oxidoreductase [Streptomyces sp. NPDC002734]|uniref:oxidoreductase n=1 Tax=Streptomyces sp. NPDC002734 TaxID=3154426 RepID=UPI0033206675